MNPTCRLPALIALLFCSGARLLAGEAFTLQTEVYVFKHGDFQTVKFPGATAPGATHGLVLPSPASAQFDQETLTLAGANFAWSGGRNPPHRFSRINAPAMTLPAGTPATLLSTVPVQYFEKLADGTLQVREIAGDSPEAPHCRLTFTIGLAPEAGRDLPLTCELDVATVRARASVPGVSLEVGKPVLARFQDKLSLQMRREEWSALLLQAPNGNDYSLLVLLKIMPRATPAAVSPASQAGVALTAAELDAFVTFYYRHPRPELVGRAITALRPSGFIKDRAQVLVGFFAEIFAANPERMAEWQQLIEREDEVPRNLLERARKLGRAGTLLASTQSSIEENDRIWGAFFATGNAAYLRKLTAELKLFDENWLETFWPGATAMWSLARNAPEHPLVRTTLAEEQKTADPRTRQLIAVLLDKDPEVIRQMILDRKSRLKYLNSGDRGPGYIYTNVPNAFGEVRHHSP